jgi:hypothetical protein
LILIPIVAFAVLAWWVTETLHLEWWIGVLLYIVVPIPLMGLFARFMESRQIAESASPAERAAVIRRTGSQEEHAIRIQDAYVLAGEAGRTRDASAMRSTLATIAEEAAKGNYSDVEAAARAAGDALGSGNAEGYETAIKRLTRAIYRLK